MHRHPLLAGVLGLMLIDALPANEQPPSPAADPGAVVVSGNARFTVLTPALIRLEWSPTGAFEDRSTLLVLNRRLPVPKLEVTRQDGWLTVTTDKLTLRYREDGGRFDAQNLTITSTSSPRPFNWHPGLTDEGNLFGARISLDGVSGSAPLKPGLVSRDGWALVDDSIDPLFAGDRPSFPAPRDAKDAVDWYFFGYGHDYKQALTDYVKLAGPIPLPPRFVFGAWWSRYWPYTDEELKDLVKQFEDHDVPLDVLVIDMDWHQEGWSGYSWEPKYFPDPEGFLKWAHERGLRVTLNLHPGFDIEKHEMHYAEFANALGIDPEKVDRIPYDHAKREWAEAYFKSLIHPLEKQGVDFWWLDYAGHTPPSAFEGFDGLLWCNAMHYLDNEWNNRRGLIFSRWGGLPNHRYQIGFTGDTYSTWESLAFQPWFTATGGNVCFPFWSHDIGGHYVGPCEPELYARWIQWGAFSPTLRTHATRNPLAERRIWAFPEDVFQSARQAFQLRYELIPYIYSAARQCYDTAVPLCRPLYYEWPEIEEAYTYKAGILFGDQFYVAPVAAPGDAVSRCAQIRVWIPPGEWTNWFTGQTPAGPAYAQLSVPLNETPLFVRSGGVIPAAPKMHRSGEKPVDPLIVHIFPGESGQTELYEDDGETLGYRNGEWVRTAVSHRLVDGKRRIEIKAAQGSYSGMLKERIYELRLRDVWPAASVTLDGRTMAATPAGSTSGWWYEPESLSVVIRLPRGPVDKDRVVVVESQTKPAEDRPLRDGLRGRLRLIEEINGLLGDKMPLEARGALKVRQLLPKKTDEAVKIADYTIANWGLMLSRALDADAEPAVAEKVAARLLGGSYALRLEQGKRDQIAPTIVMDLASTPPFGGLKDIAGYIRLTVPDGWRFAAQDDDKRPTDWDVPLDGGRTATVKATMIPDGQPRTGSVIAEYVIRHGKRELRASLTKVLLPSIDKWWIVGPFDNPEEQGLSKVFPPEEGIDLKAEYEGKGGLKIGWKKAEREIAPGVDLTADFAINFHEFFGQEYGDAVAYGLTYLHAPADMDVVLALGSDDGVAVWLNGQEVHRNLVNRPYVARQDRVPIHLKKGTNTLLMKINQGGGGWGFGADIETPDGKPVPEVEARLTP